MNLHSQLPLLRLRKAKQNRFNPLPNISEPSQVSRKLDSFEAGHLKEAVNIFEALEQREDLIRAVVSKRKKAVGREGWTIQLDSRISQSQHFEAEQHVAALEYFYRNLRVENALDRSEKGGFKLLCRQMMDAIGKRFAVHEIVWQVGPRPPGAPSFQLTAAAQRNFTSHLTPRTSNLSQPSAVQNLDSPFSPLPPVQNSLASAPTSALHAQCPRSTSSLVPPTSNLPFLPPVWDSPKNMDTREVV